MGEKKKMKAFILPPISISMLMEGPIVYEALQHAFGEVTRETLGGCWWGKVFCWHCKWPNHLLHLL